MWMADVQTNPYGTPLSLHPTPFTLHPTPYTLRPTPCRQPQTAALHGAERAHHVLIRPERPRLVPLHALRLFPKPETQNLRPETRNPKSETLSGFPKTKIRNPKPKTQNPKPEIRDPRPETRNPKRSQASRARWVGAYGLATKGFLLNKRKSVVLSVGT